MLIGRVASLVERVAALSGGGYVLIRRSEGRWAVNTRRNMREHVNRGETVEECLVRALERLEGKR